MSAFTDDKSLVEAIIKLFEDERFYGEIIMSMSRVASTSIPTMGVCIKDRVELHVNYAFFATLTLPERVALLKHEAGHILNDHIPRFRQEAPDVFAASKDVVDQIINQAKFKTMNVAADLALNCNIRDLPQGGCFPKNFDLKDGETFEWYLEHLKDNEKMKGLAKFDGHPLWAQSQGSKDELKEKLRQAINKAAERTRASGHMSSSDELIVSRMNYKPKDWKADLRRFAANSLDAALETSRKKRNRRYGLRQPGYVKTETLHLGVAIDTSGSMSDAALNQAMAEIARIARYAKVTVVEADAEVKNSYEFDPKKTYTVSGRGGTAYQPAFDFFSKDKTIDGVIYIGDMDTSDEVKKPKYPVLWAIVGNQAPPADFGFRTKIEVTGERE